jgi:hypothetical protein
VNYSGKTSLLTLDDSQVVAINERIADERAYFLAVVLRSRPLCKLHQYQGVDFS